MIRPDVLTDQQPLIGDLPAEELDVLAFSRAVADTADHNTDMDPGRRYSDAASDQGWGPVPEPEAAPKPVKTARLKSRRPYRESRFSDIGSDTRAYDPACMTSYELDSVAPPFDPASSELRKIEIQRAKDALALGSLITREYTKYGLDAKTVVEEFVNGKPNGDSK